jgi:hypothetical protein
MTTNECARGRQIGLACTIMSMEGVQHGRICIIHMYRLDRIGLHVKGVFGLEKVTQVWYLNLDWSTSTWSGELFVKTA